MATATKKRPTVEKRIDDYGRKIAKAKRSAAAKLHDDCTKGEVGQAVRELAKEVHSVPAPIRAMGYLMGDATALVKALTAAGVRFASRKNAPAQIAGSAYAAWAVNHGSAGECPANWTLVQTLFVQGVVHALHHKEGTPELAREMLEHANQIPAGKRKAR